MIMQMLSELDEHAQSRIAHWLASHAQSGAAGSRRR